MALLVASLTCLNLEDPVSVSTVLTVPVCCIYHRPKGVDESSDESSSDSDASSSESDGGPSTGRKIRAGDGRKKPKPKRREHDHDHNHGHDHDHNHDHGRRDGRRAPKRPPSPNAYEKVPKPKPKAAEGSEGKTNS